MLLYTRHLILVDENPPLDSVSTRTLNFSRLPDMFHDRNSQRREQSEMTADERDSLMFQILLMMGEDRLLTFW